MTSYIFFVHGWRGEGDFKQTPCENTFLKVSETLKNKYANKCKFEYYDYRTGPLKFPAQQGDKDFIQNARGLLNKIDGVIADHKKRANSESDELKIFLIGHSAGGLVIRQALTTAYEIPSDRENSKYVKNVILIASPAAGTPLLQLVKDVLKVDIFNPISHQLIQLAPSSNFVTNLNRQWSSWGQNLNNTCIINCIYGSKDTIAPPPALNSDCIPDPPNACMRDQKCVIQKCVIIDGVGHNDILNCPVFTKRLETFLLVAGL